MTHNTSDHTHDPDPPMSDEQQRVERLVSSIRNDLGDLMAMRLDPETAMLLEAEEANLGSAHTSLQILLSHIAITADVPRLRVVR
jgi:hypothetical protein